ncbi:MAG: hypothetical protein IPH62_11675 [Ignavibacteriae bacterium]|nr:hypothetical protein [Ignavibacteriota bacterium]
MIDDEKLSDKEKIRLFFSLFHGLENVYGTYSTQSGKHWQIKGKVTEKVIENHLKGKQPYGFYPLISDKTSVAVADFDNLDPRPPIEFIKKAEHYGLSSYLEKSKSKGYHVWLFFPKDGINAKKVRQVIKFILMEIDSINTEVFPKQDSITDRGSYGNFINAPLFGKQISKNKTVFIHPNFKLESYPNQWEFLNSIKINTEQLLDSIISNNDIINERKSKESSTINYGNSKFGLPICAKKILRDGVTFDQRIASFRLAINLKRIGTPKEQTIEILNDWKQKNKPINGKKIITKKEIKEQVGWAYSKDYKGFGCEVPIIKSFCDPKCKTNRI